MCRVLHTSGSQPEGPCAPRGMFGKGQGQSWLSPLQDAEGGMPLASSGWGPGKLLNVLQCTDSPPTTENRLPANVSDAEVEKPRCRPLCFPEPPRPLLPTGQMSFELSFMLGSALQICFSTNLHFFLVIHVFIPLSPSTQVYSASVMALGTMLTTLPILPLILMTLRGNRHFSPQKIMNPIY